MKIGIMGVGGIGGFIAGALGKAGECELTCVARGAHLAAIKAQGLKVHSDRLGEFTVRPHMATDKPAEVMDAVFVCVKGYSIDEAAVIIQPMVDAHTLVIPMLNGIGTAERLSERLQKGVILDGCIYLSSFVRAPGEIAQVNKDLCRVVFGAPKGVNASSERMEELAQLLRRADVPAEVSGDIEYATWEKYSFICSFGAASAYYGMTAGELRRHPEAFETLMQLAEELIGVANAKGVMLPVEVKAKVRTMAESLSEESKSSLQRDLETPGKPNERGLFCAEVARLAKTLGVSAKTHERVAKALDEKSQA